MPDDIVSGFMALLLMLTGGAAVSSSVIRNSTAIPEEYPHMRSNAELCSELEREVNLSIKAGLLTKAEAGMIVTRCHHLYKEA